MPFELSAPHRKIIKQSPKRASLVFDDTAFPLFGHSRFRWWPFVGSRPVQILDVEGRNFLAVHKLSGAPSSRQSVLLRVVCVQESSLPYAPWVEPSAQRHALSSPLRRLQKLCVIRILGGDGFCLPFD